jgi:gamma-glutamyltranspeptidase / glutathione hydrolase
MRRSPWLIPSVLSLLLTACGTGEGPGASGSAAPLAYTIPEFPEPASGYQAKPGWSHPNFQVAAANPLATDAGAQILRAGGTAVDAAIAVQMVLTLVEPQSSGIGGGTFLLHWDGTEVTAFDGREVAPAAADPDLFLDAAGRPLPFAEAVASGLSVGVPGTMAMLAEAHRLHGRLPWRDLFVPAITLATEGFALSPRLHMLLEGDRVLREDPIARALYYDAELTPHPVGTRIRNPALAEVLRRVSEEGVDAFYLGAVAEDIVARVKGHPERPGRMEVSDLAAYPNQDFRRASLCSPWRAYQICGFPPPSSGHLTVMQILGILDELVPPGQPGWEFIQGLPSPSWMHAYLEASKLAFADRNLYIADPAFVDAPGGNWENLLDPRYLNGRAMLVEPRAMPMAEPGTPPGGTALAWAPQGEQPERGTSHVSIVDAEGRAVSMTTTIESGFGSRIMSDGGTGLLGGFHLNNELTDFSLLPAEADGRPIANRVEAGKRPRSSMAPALVFRRDNGAFVASLGSPGGAAIIHFTAKTLLGMLAWELDAQRAIDLPNFVNYNGPTTLEAGAFPTTFVERLRERGHEIREGDLTSGLQAIQRLPEGGLFGGADPRREGVVIGG